MIDMCHKVAEKVKGLNFKHSFASDSRVLEVETVFVVCRRREKADKRRRTFVVTSIAP